MTPGTVKLGTSGSQAVCIKGLETLLRKEGQKTPQDGSDRAMEFLESFAFVVEGIERVANTSRSDELQGSTRQVVEHFYDLSRRFSGDCSGQL
jgi:hypothetical protein